MRREKRTTELLPTHSLNSNCIEKENGKVNRIQIELDEKIYRDYLAPPDVKHPLEKEVKEFLITLNAKERILLQARAQGIPYKEISAWTGIPIENAKVYYSRLKKKLEQYLLKEEISNGKRKKG